MQDKYITVTRTPEERLEIIQEGVKDLQKTLDEIRKEKKA